MVCLAPMRRNTPTAGLEVILDQKPIDLVITGEGLKSFLRTRGKFPMKWQGVGKSNKRLGHILKWEKIILEGKIEPIHEDKAPLCMSWKKPFTTKAYPKMTKLAVRLMLI